MTETEQLYNKLQANLKFIENTDNYFSMFKYVMSSCAVADFINHFLHSVEEITDSIFIENAHRIEQAEQLAIRTHGEWTIKTLEQSKTKHTTRTFVSSLYSDIFGTELN